MKPKDKRPFQKRHAISRAKVRYDLDLTEEEYELLCKKIRSRRKVYRYYRAGDRIVAQCNYNNSLVWAVYDEFTKAVVTFLTPDQVRDTYGHLTSISV